MRKSIKCSVIVLSVLTNSTPFYLLPSLPSGEHHLCFFTICKTTTCSVECNTLALFGSAPHTCATCQCAPHKCSAETAATTTETAICTACCCVCCVLCCTSLWFINKRQSLFMNFRFQFNGTEPERPQRYRYIEPRSSHHHPYGLNCMNYFDKIQNTAQWR